MIRIEAGVYKDMVSKKRANVKRLLLLHAQYARMTGIIENCRG
jgi:hypothetical protein